jgi:TolB-like protein
VYAYDGGQDPRVAVTLRMVAAEGTVLFSDLVSLRAEDAEGLFDFGKTVTREELAREAVRRLCGRLPRPGAAPLPIHARSRPLHVAAVRTFRSSALATGTRHRVAILPFANAGPHEAARIVAEILARRLNGSNLFEVVEPADFREAFVAEKIRELSDPAELQRLGKSLGTTLFLTGTIYEFVEPVQADSATPRLEMEATLTDVATGEIVWTSYASRRGTDYRGLLELGAITSVIGLADQSVSEMIHAAEKSSPSAARTAGRELSRTGKKETP